MKWRKEKPKMYYVTAFLKSGQEVYFQTPELEINSNKMTWSREGVKGVKLLSIDIDQIAAITYSE